MNQIPALQASEKQLARLKAQRALYSKAKHFLAAQVVMIVQFAAVWAVLGIFYPDTKIVAGIWSIAVVILDHFFFTPRQRALKGMAARIQEAFDCDVLSLEWRSIVAGSRPDPEDVVEWSKKYRPDPKAPIEEWYPLIVGELPQGLARAVCQRANCWWDAELRRRYARWSIAVVVVVFVISFLAGIAGHFKMEQWVLSALVPLLPVFNLCFRQCSEQKEAADRLDGLKRHAEKIWADLLSGVSEDERLSQARELQDEIFDHRKRSPLIFNWIYNLLRNEQEEQMNKGAAELIEEAKIK
jgi:hypothetical protein